MVSKLLAISIPHLHTVGCLSSPGYSCYIHILHPTLNAVYHYSQLKLPDISCAATTPHHVRQEHEFFHNRHLILRIMPPETPRQLRLPYSD